MNPPPKVGSNQVSYHHFKPKTLQVYPPLRPRKSQNIKSLSDKKDRGAFAAAESPIWTINCSIFFRKFSFFECFREKYHGKKLVILIPTSCSELQSMVIRFRDYLKFFSEFLEKSVEFFFEFLKHSFLNFSWIFFENFLRIVFEYFENVSKFSLEGFLKCFKIFFESHYPVTPLPKRGNKFRLSFHHFLPETLQP